MSDTQGFTLIELLVAMAVALVLLTVGVPSMGSFLGNNRVSGQTNDFVTHLNLARSEAVKRGISVSLCPSTDQATCANSTDWSSGWIIFTDDTGSAGTLDGSDQLLRSREALDGGSSFTGSVNSIRYLETGIQAAAADLTFTLSARRCTGNQRRNITVRPQGYSRVQTAACS